MGYDSDEIDSMIFKKIIDVQKRQYLYEKRLINKYLIRGCKGLYNNSSVKMRKFYKREKSWKHLGSNRIFHLQNIMEKMIKKYKFMVDYCEKYNLCNKIYTKIINKRRGYLFKSIYSIQICILNFNHDILKNQAQFQEFIIENIDTDWVKNYIDNNKLKYKKE